MLKKTITIVLNVAVVAFLGVAVLVILSKFSIGGMHTYSVLSGSMEPTIGTGDFIFVRSAESYAVGDVITRTTANENINVTHRIVERIERDGAVSYRTKGDANDADDREDIAQSAIVGKVIFSLPLFGYAVEYAKQPFGFILLVVVPAVIIIYEELGKIRKEAALIWSRWQMTRDVRKR